MYCAEGRPVRAPGAVRRENVGMSNHNPNEKLRPRKSKVSVAMAINHGLGDPKAMVKTAADGKPVNIPAPRTLLKSDACYKCRRIIGFPLAQV